MKVSLTVDNQRLTPVSIEPRAVLADWITSSDELTFYTSTQVPHFVRTFVAAICGIPEAKVRVIAPDVGGGFGSKLNVYAEEFAIAQASRLTGRPVKWIETRSEAMISTIHGRDQLQTADDRGRRRRPHAGDPRAPAAGLRRVPAAAHAEHRAPHGVHGAGPV